jgi:hypothetical protein
MLFDAHVAAKRGAAGRARGFALLRRKLYFDCVLDIANLSLNKDARSPSIGKLVDKLAKDTLRSELRRIYSRYVLPVNEDEARDAEYRAAQRLMEEREEAKRAAQFDVQYADLVARWSALSTAPVLSAFKTMRDKIVAHREIEYDGKEYKTIDEGALGILWRDLPDTIEAMKGIVVLLNALIRSADFAWKHFDEMTARDVAAFWAD